jgi:hypothetical protein
MKYFENLIIMTGALICAACLTSCNDSENEDTAIHTVTPTQSTVSIMKGSTTTIAATVAPNSAEQEIRWTVEDPTVATIVDKGRIDGISSVAVTGVSLGSTTVTATSVGNPDKKATTQVTVITHIDNVTVDIDTILFVIGVTETATVEATVSPAEAIQTVTWTSSNTSVATVAGGVVRAVGTGVATITVASIIDTTKKTIIEVESVSLVNKVIHVASKFGNGLTVSWVNLGGDLVEFFYTNEAGRPVSTVVPVTTQSSYIPDFGSTPLSYRTLYLSRGTGDTLQAPVVNFTGTVYDLCHYVKSSVAENIIPACDFDIGGADIGFHDGNTTNASVNYRRDRGDSRSDAVSVEGNLCIGSISVNDWWQYTVYVENAGSYEIDLHVSVNGSSAKCRVEVDGIKSPDYSLTNNSNWSDWRYYFEFYRLEPPKFNLTAGRHAIRIYVVGTGFNYHGMRLTHKP